jgi:hypothetical protein
MSLTASSTFSTRRCRFISWRCPPRLFLFLSRRCTPFPPNGMPPARDLHSSTFRLNVSAFSGIGGASRGYLGVCRECQECQGILGGVQGAFCVRKGSGSAERWTSVSPCRRRRQTSSASPIRRLKNRRRQIRPSVLQPTCVRRGPGPSHSFPASAQLHCLIIVRRCTRTYHTLAASCSGPRFRVQGLGFRV